MLFSVPMEVLKSSYGMILWMIIIGLAYRKWILLECGRCEKRPSSDEPAHESNGLLKRTRFRVLFNYRKKGQIRVSRL